MDASETRRGQLCWYKLPDIQLDAVNDALILESFMYFLLKKFFRWVFVASLLRGGVVDVMSLDSHDKSYVALLELYQEVTLQTEMGQQLDLMSQPQGRPKDINSFNMDLYVCSYVFRKWRGLKRRR